MHLHRANTHWGATTLLAPRLPDSSRYPFQVPNQHPRVWQTSPNIPKHPQASPSIPKHPDTELSTNYDTYLQYLAMYHQVRGIQNAPHLDSGTPCMMAGQQTDCCCCCAAQTTRCQKLQSANGADYSRYTTLLHYYTTTRAYIYIYNYSHIR